MKTGPGESKETFVLVVKIVKIALIHALVAKSVLLYVPVKPIHNLFSSWSWRSCLDGIFWGEFIIKLFCVIFALDKIHICTGQKCLNFLSLGIFVTLVERSVLLYVPVKPFHILFSSWSWRSCLDGIFWGEFIIELFCVIFALDRSEVFQLFEFKHFCDPS